MFPMFGIASRYVKDRRKAPAFHIFHLCLSSGMQGKSLAFSTTKSGDFAELNGVNLRRTEIGMQESNVRMGKEVSSLLLSHWF